MKIIFGNLKMNFLFKDFVDYIAKMQASFEKQQPKVFLGIAVPYIYLERAAAAIGHKVSVIAQDIHYAASGSFTSSVSASQISSLNVKWTLIGHSECRKLNQDKETIAKKIIISHLNGLQVVYCCGADPINEITSELFCIEKENLSKLIIAFEPVASIGTGQALDENLANDKLGEIKELLIKKWGTEGKNVKLLYGGSVSLTNYKQYLEKDNIDGVLVGGASLKLDDFWTMATLS